MDSESIERDECNIYVVLARTQATECRIVYKVETPMITEFLIVV